MTTTTPAAEPMTGAEHYAEAGRLLVEAKNHPMTPHEDSCYRAAAIHAQLAHTAMEAAKLGSDAARVQAATDWHKSAFGGYRHREVPR